MCEQTASCATYIINWLVFITETKSVYSAVRTGPLNKAIYASSLKGEKGQENQKKTLMLSSISAHILDSIYACYFHKMSYYMQNFYKILKYIEVKPHNIVSYYLPKILWVHFMQKPLNCRLVSQKP